VEFLILVHIFSGISNSLSDLHIDIARRLVGLKGMAGLVSGKGRKEEQLSVCLEAKTAIS
jgi:hypothetical protein